MSYHPTKMLDFLAATLNMTLNFLLIYGKFFLISNFCKEENYGLNERV